MVEARAEGKLEAGIEAKEDMKIAGKMKARVETNVEAKLPAQVGARWPRNYKSCVSEALMRKREVRGSALTWRKAVP